MILYPYWNLKSIWTSAWSHCLYAKTCKSTDGDNLLWNAIGLGHNDYPGDQQRKRILNPRLGNTYEGPPPTSALISDLSYFNLVKTSQWGTNEMSGRDGGHETLQQTWLGIHDGNQPGHHRRTNPLHGKGLLKCIWWSAEVEWRTSTKFRWGSDGRACPAPFR